MCAAIGQQSRGEGEKPQKVAGSCDESLISKKCSIPWVFGKMVFGIEIGRDTKRWLLKMCSKRLKLFFLTWLLFGTVAGAMPCVLRLKGCQQKSKIPKRSVSWISTRAAFADQVCRICGRRSIEQTSSSCRRAIDENYWFKDYTCIYSIYK